MSEFTQPIPAKTSGSFASLLASLTGKRADDSWDDTALADDTTTITYEQALRSHRRVRSSESATETLPNESSNSAPLSSKAAEPPPGEETCKTASITLRLTASERKQLQDRAATAQLSVSAYLRSCIFEAESLRSQVKEALAQMQAATQARTAGKNPLKSAEHNRLNLFRRWLMSPRAETPSSEAES